MNSRQGRQYLIIRRPDRLNCVCFCENDDHGDRQGTKVLLILKTAIIREQRPKPGCRRPPQQFTVFDSVPLHVSSREDIMPW